MKISEQPIPKELEREIERILSNNDMIRAEAHRVMILVVMRGLEREGGEILVSKKDQAIVVRKGSMDDTDKIRRLGESLKKEHEPWRRLGGQIYEKVNEEEWVKGLLGPRTWLILALDGRTIVGHVNGGRVTNGKSKKYCQPGDVPGFLGIVIKKEYESQGVLEALVSKAVEEAERLGVTSLLRWTDARHITQIEALESIGFRRVGEEVSRGPLPPKGTNRVVMRLDI